jgi:alpha-1,3-rhamnosyl/mannosyltransferase
VRITLDARIVGFPGIGRFVTGLWRALRDLDDIDVIGLWPHAPFQHWLGEHVAAPAGDHLRVRGRPFLPLEQVAVPMALRRAHADVHHAPHFNVPYVARVPTVLTVHDLIAYHDPSKARSRAAGAYYRALFPRAVHRATTIVAVSQHTKRAVCETFAIAEDRVRVIDAGIDHTRWRPQAADAVEAVRSNFDLPSEYLLYVGTAKPHKNLVTLLAAHGRSLPPLVLAGPTRTEVAALGGPACDPARVIVLGRVPDATLPGLYSGARALVLPSLHEGCGLTPLEAMACGTPAVVSDGGALPDTVGDAAIVVPALDRDAWADALARVNTDDVLRARLRNAGAQRVRARTWDACARQYAAVYREAAA